MCLFPRETDRVTACRHLAIAPRVKSPTSWDFGLVVEKEKRTCETFFCKITQEGSSMIK